MINWMRNLKTPHSPVRLARQRSAAPVLENLDQRCLLDAGIGTGAVVAHARIHLGHALEVRSFHPTKIAGEPISLSNGVVVKMPHFYENYVGPKLAQLNAVAAAGLRFPNGDFEFIGVNQARIDPHVQATYVWGIDRSGKLPTGPFPNRPNIRFDAIVVVKLVPGKTPTTTVIDLAANKATILPQTSTLIAGQAIAVKVPGNLLPSTGLDPKHFRFDYWPEDGQAGAQHIASFAPELNDAAIGEIAAGASA